MADNVRFSWPLESTGEGPESVPGWVTDCPVGDSREEVEVIGSMSVTYRVDRRPLTGMDLAGSMVGMDKAEDSGLLAWPDIVGKMVNVAWLDADARWVGGPGYRTRVDAVGPLGILATWEEPDGETATGLIPWGAAVISWEADR